MIYDIATSVTGGLIVLLIQTLVKYLVHKKNDRPQSGKLDGHSSQ